MQFQLISEENISRINQMNEEIQRLHSKNNQIEVHFDILCIKFYLKNIFYRALTKIMRIIIVVYCR